VDDAADDGREQTSATGSHPDDFCRKLEQALELPTKTVSPDHRLREDLHFDSILLLELLLWLEECGVEVTEHDLSDFNRVSDVFVSYQRAPSISNADATLDGL